MRSFALTVVAALASHFVACLPAHAEADGPDYFRITGIAPDKALNVRAAPGIDSRRVGSIPAGSDGIRNLGCQGGLSFAEWQNASEAERKGAQRSRWCRVRFKDIEGWVAARFLAEGTTQAQQVEKEEQAVKEGTRWRLVGSPAGPAVGKAWLSIATNGDIRGNSGCNNFFASGSFGAGSFKLTTPIGATRKLCPEDELNKQETALFSALERAATFDFNLRTGSLWVMDKDDETLLEFQLN